MGGTKLAICGFAMGYGMIIRLLKIISAIFMLATMPSAHGARMDLTTHDMVIERLEMGLDGLDKKENAASRPAIQLRLADLYSDRARLKAMAEIEKSCNDCHEAQKDRKTAIKYYQDALPNAKKEDQGSIVLQIAHLLNLNGQSSKSSELYTSIANAKAGTYSSESKGMAFSALGEIQFRKGDFKNALKNFRSAKQNTLKNRGFVEYRIGWCLLNLGQEKQATKTIVNLLQNPELMATQTTDGKTVDITFIDDVSGDLALFLARGTVSLREVNLLRNLSPDKARRNNLKTLAEETDRLGKKGASLVVWAAYVDEGDVSNTEKLEVQTRVAQIFYDMNKQDLAANAYEKALNIWKKNGCQEKQICDDLKIRLKKFVTAWNKSQKDKPTMNVFRAYIAYLNVFNDDAEMFHWAAIVGEINKRYAQAADLFHQAAVLAAGELKKTPDNKTMKNIFEGSMLAEIEMAEATKNKARQEQAYNFYLAMNPAGEKAFEVRYQRAHLFYESKNYTQGLAEFHFLATQPGKANRDLKVKSADLALDTLVAMKNDKELQNRSLEYARMFPERQKEYLKISRTASLNMVEDKSQDAVAALAILNATNMNGASDAEKIKFFKNKIILAQKARELEQVKSAANELLKIKSLSNADQEYAMEQKVWVSELQLNFSESYRLTQKMDLPRLSKSDRLLRLALLAELAGRNARSHYEQYLSMNRNSRAGHLVRVTLIKNANYSWREIDKHLSYLRNSPDLLAPLVLEAFAAKKDYAKAERLLKTTKIGRYAAGQTLGRYISLQDLWKFDREIRNHRLLGYNDHALTKSLNERLKLIAKSEKNAKWAIQKHDWTLQVLTLSQLSRENKRLYKDIMALPIPSKLKGEDRQRYQQLLAQRSQPYADRAAQIEREVAAMWSESNTWQNIEAVYQQASPELRSLYRNELVTLSQSAPDSAKNRLDNLLNTPYRRPTRQQVMFARRELEADPFSESKVQRLRDLESQSGGTSMVAYLDARLNELKKRKSL